MRRVVLQQNMPTHITFRSASVVGNNPASFDSPIVLHILLELEGKLLEDPIDVRLTWSPIWDTCVDQELAELEVDLQPHLGIHAFTLTIDPPQIAEIPDPTGPTALLVSFSYRGEEFLHLGFNVLVKIQNQGNKAKNNSNDETLTDDEEEELPEVITSSEGVTRYIIEKCFPKHTCIKAWESPPHNPSHESNGENRSEDDNTEKGRVSKKRQKCDSDSSTSGDESAGDGSHESSVSVCGGRKRLKRFEVKT